MKRGGAALRAAGRYAALLLLSLLALGMTASPWALAAPAALLVLPPLTLLWSLWARRGLRASLTLPGSGAKGAALAGEVLIWGRAAAGPVQCELLVRNDLTGEEERLLLPLEPVPGGCRGTFRTVTRHCGRLRVRVEALRLYDLCGLFFVRGRAEAARTATVLPETFPVELDQNLLRAAPESDGELRAGRAGADRQDTFQLREYRPGDDLRGIHWKLSAKQDQLVYREPGLPMKRSLLLCWQKGGAQAADLDAMAEVVFSLAQALSEAGCPFTLGWSEDGENHLEEISGQDDLVRQLPLLLRRGAGPACPDPDFAAFGRVLLVTAAPETRAANVLTLCCGESAGADVSFTPENYRECLERLDVPDEA